jgi:hypothetical protein
MGLKNIDWSNHGKNHEKSHYLGDQLVIGEFRERRRRASEIKRGIEILSGFAFGLGEVGNDSGSREVHDQSIMAKVFGLKRLFQDKNYNKSWTSTTGGRKIDVGHTEKEVGDEKVRVRNSAQIRYRDVFELTKLKPGLSGF